MELFYIRNRGVVGNCLIFWREWGNGYTCNLDEAGKFPRSEAERIVRYRPEQDQMLPVERVDRLAQRHVDIQKLKMMLP